MAQEQTTSRNTNRVTCKQHGRWLPSRALLVNQACTRQTGVSQEPNSDNNKQQTGAGQEPNSDNKKQANHPTQRRGRRHHYKSIQAITHGQHDWLPVRIIKTYYPSLVVPSEDN